MGSLNTGSSSLPTGGRASSFNEKRSSSTEIPASQRLADVLRRARDAKGRLGFGRSPRCRVYHRVGTDNSYPQQLEDFRLSISASAEAPNFCSENIGGKRCPYI